MTFNLTIKNDLRELLASQQVEVSSPRSRMLELKAVPVGDGFSKSCTNLLMWDRDRWRLYVDDDLVYTGDDHRRAALLEGASRKRWRRLSPPEPFVGDVNAVLLAALELLDSPLRKLLDASEAPAAGGTGEPDETDFDYRPDWYARLLDVRQFNGRDLLPTAAQARAVERIVLAAMRSESPVCPMLIGPSGSGKSTAARLAAERLVRSGAVRNAFVIGGASLHAGVAYEAERDERLAEAFSVAAAAKDPLVIFEQIDLLLIASKLVHALTADLVDRGVRLIGVAQPEFDPRRLRGGGALRRRVEWVGLDPAQPAEMLRVIAARLANWPAARGLEVVAEAVAAAVRLSSRSAAVEPAGSIGLMESVLIAARQRGLSIVGPDEVYHCFTTLTREEFHDE